MGTVTAKGALFTYRSRKKDYNQRRLALALALALSVCLPKLLCPWAVAVSACLCPSRSTAVSCCFLFIGSDHSTLWCRPSSSFTCYSRPCQDLEPDVLFVDGNGRLHPRGAGLACHLGVVTGLRTVGLGKTFLHVDGLTKTGVREVGCINSCGCINP